MYYITVSDSIGYITVLTLKIEGRNKVLIDEEV